MGEVGYVVGKWAVVTVGRVSHAFVKILPRVALQLGSKLFRDKLGQRKEARI